jgi:hypothetical protein
VTGFQEVREMSISLVSLAAAASGAAGGVDWFRTIGLAGIMGVWVWRGFATVASRRRQRAADAAESRQNEDERSSE